ncbi:MAG: rhodanese-like domain-containing protein [Nitrospinota bacterium]
MSGKWPVSNVFVDFKYVLDNMDEDNVILVDTRSEEDYLKGHIPGAICLGEGKIDAAFVFGDDLIRTRPAEELIKILGSKGISPKSEIIIYGGKSDPHASVIYWILDVLSFPEIRFYNDGIDDAVNGGVELETGMHGMHTMPSVTFTATKNTELIATTDRVFENLTSKNAQLVDSRSEGENKGTDARALRGGKIPGAIHIHVQDNWVDAKSKELKPVEELKKLYSVLDPDREIICYCYIGIRSTYNYIVLKALGFKKIRNYDESWIIWGNRIDLPVENRSWFDSGSFKFLFKGMRMFDGVLGVIKEGMEKVESKIDMKEIKEDMPDTVETSKKSEARRKVAEKPIRAAFC